MGQDFYGCLRKQWDQLLLMPASNIAVHILLSPKNKNLHGKWLGIIQPYEPVIIFSDGAEE